jgi:hypothetical protein
MWANKSLHAPMPRGQSSRPPRVDHIKLRILTLGAAAVEDSIDRNGQRAHQPTASSCYCALRV